MTQQEIQNYDMMVELGIATAEELNLAWHLLDGDWGKVIDTVCYIRTGYRTFEDFMADEEVF